jgi:hypothetical protein
MKLILSLSCFGVYKNVPPNSQWIDAHNTKKEVITPRHPNLTTTKIYRMSQTY